MHHCPRCRSSDIHRSRTRTGWESWRKAITAKRPYRCRACGWRGWGVDRGPRFADREIEVALRAVAGDPLNGDGNVGRSERRPEIDLDELDSLESVGAKRK